MSESKQKTPNEANVKRMKSSWLRVAIVLGFAGACVIAIYIVAGGWTNGGDETGAGLNKWAKLRRNVNPFVEQAGAGSTTVLQQKLIRIDATRLTTSGGGVLNPTSHVITDESSLQSVQNLLIALDASWNEQPRGEVLALLVDWTFECTWSDGERVRFSFAGNHLYYGKFEYDCRLTPSQAEALADALESIED